MLPPTLFIPDSWCPPSYRAGCALRQGRRGSMPARGAAAKRKNRHRHRRRRHHNHHRGTRRDNSETAVVSSCEQSMLPLGNYTDSLRCVIISNKCCKYGNETNTKVLSAKWGGLSQCQSNINQSQNTWPELLRFHYTVKKWRNLMMMNCDLSRAVVVDLFSRTSF